MSAGSFPCPSGASRSATQLPAYALITPAHNEAAYIERTIRSMLAQTVVPIRWIIVNDGSTDGTERIVQRITAACPWIELIHLPPRETRHFAGKVLAFNAGIERLKNCRYEIVGNLDADISFGPDHFAFLLRKFAENPQLGVAGTAFIENEAIAYDYDYVNIEHVSGQCQVFRRSCFEHIGGYLPIKGGGIDWAAVTSARMKGWETRTFPERVFVHHRTMGTGSGSALSAAFRFGRQDYYLGSHPLWELFRCLYQMKHKPLVIKGLLILSGYTWAFLRRTPRPISHDLVAFRRREQMQRLSQILGRVLLQRSTAKSPQDNPGARAAISGTVRSEGSKF